MSEITLTVALSASCSSFLGDCRLIKGKRQGRDEITADETTQDKAKQDKKTKQDKTRHKKRRD